MTVTRSRIMPMLVKRLSEASTYRGIFILISAIGFIVPDELGTAITAFGMAAAGLVGVLMGDRIQPPVGD